MAVNYYTDTREDSLDAEASLANRDVPILQAHGTMDPMVPLQRGQAAHQALTARGYAVEWHDYPMPHSVCPQEIADLNRWLLRVLA